MVNVHLEDKEGDVRMNLRETDYDDGSSSGLCQMTGFSIIGVEPSSFATRVLVLFRDVHRSS
jgi:hypothetical protein